MGILSLLHSIADYKIKLAHARKFNAEADWHPRIARAEVGKLQAEAHAKLATVQLERDKFMFEVEERSYVLNRETTALNYAMRAGAPEVKVGTVVYEMPPVQIPAQSTALPDPYKFSDVLQYWQPSEDGILLARTAQQLITAPPGETLCHTTFAGRTDAGKTNNERMLMIQASFPWGRWSTWQIITTAPCAAIR